MLYNEIKKNFIIPNAFENWREYREILTKYLIQTVECQEEADLLIKEKKKIALKKSENKKEKSKNPTLMILGAGACNDFDLSLLMKHFSKITLLDYDEISMRQAIKKYALSRRESGKIEIRKISLNGIGEEEYSSFCDELQNFIRQRGREISCEEFEAYALCLVEHFLGESKRSGRYLSCLKENEYDYICCFGLHSQLQAMFSYIYRAFEQNLLKMFWQEEMILSQNFMARLVAEDEEFIPRFHDALFQSARKKVFIGCEYARCQEIEIDRMQNGEISMEVVEPIEGAYQAIRDLRERKLDRKEYTLTWPFAPQYGIFYNMVVEEFTVDRLY